MCDEQLEPPISGLQEREQRDMSVLNGHLDRETSPDLSVIDGERPHFCLAFGDGQVARPVVTHQSDIIIESIA